MELNVHMIKSLLDVTAERHQVLANNIANVNTPGYVRRDLHFREAMMQAMEGGKARDFKNLETEVVEDRSGHFRPDGNNVSTQEELGQMSQNELLYRLAVRAMTGKLTRIKKAIGGGPAA